MIDADGSAATVAAVTARYVNPLPEHRRTPGAEVVVDLPGGIALTVTCRRLGGTLATHLPWGNGGEAISLSPELRAAVDRAVWVAVRASLVAVAYFARSPADVERARAARRSGMVEQAG